jgi:hypothetical protein
MGRDHRVAVKQQRLWERVATHQREETQKAVMENIRLRALLEGQLQVARSLETALRKKPRFAVRSNRIYVWRSGNKVKVSDTLCVSLVLGGGAEPVHRQRLDNPH